jgi:hypothetical protein
MVAAIQMPQTLKATPQPKWAHGQMVNIQVQKSIKAIKYLA